jgi:cellulose synthase/poly-beta-1,6-N-acetylglucosamine synthase-like glycosyltransferase/peptidoglycan/xylan/chitin deacetylase (PgdA/CDA1 family)
VSKDPRGQWLLVALGSVTLLIALLFHGFSQGTLGEAPHQKDGAPTTKELRDAGPVIDLSGDRPRSMRMPAGTIALTFDDGPDPRWTPQILDVLKRHNAHATFFTVGARVAENPALVRRMLREGHEVGSHTFTHVDMGAAPVTRQELELDLTQRALAGAAGVRTRLWRPPYSSVPDAVTESDLAAAERAAGNGYLLVLTDRDTEDWQRPGVPQIVARATAETKRGEGAVIMMHDAGGPRDQTVLGLDQVLTELKGNRFATISEALGMPRSDVPAQSADKLIGGALVTAQRSSDWVIGTLEALFAITALLTFLRLAVLVGFARAQARRRTRDVPPYDAPVTVVLPAYNEESGVASAILSIIATTHPLELIVVDDGSTDRTAEIVEELIDSLPPGSPPVRLIRKVNGGKPSALNAGITEAAHDLIVMVDGDTVFQPDTLGHLLRPFADARVGAVSGNTKVANRGGILGGWQHLEYVVGFNLDRRMYDMLGCMPTIPGAIGAFRREALVQAGGVSTETLAEDTDLSMAICRAGWRIAYAEKALAWTEAPDSLSQLWRQRYRWCYGTLQSVWKHRKARGTLGFVAIPYLLLFQVMLPLIAPSVDVFLLYGLFILDPKLVLFSYLVFTGVQALVVGYALWLDGEKYRTLWTLPLQQVVYRQLMYLVVIQSITSALLGSRLRWHTTLRTGTFAMADRLPVEKAVAEPADSTFSDGSRIRTAPEPPERLVGRKTELALLDETLISAAGGQPELVVIEGSPGMGVTSLLSQLITHAATFQIAYARCVPLEQSFAYGVLRQLFPDADEEPVTHAASESGDLRKAAMEGYLQRVATLSAAQPLLIIIDDVQWADRASLEWLDHLTARWSRLSLAVILGRTSRGALTLPACALRVPLTPLSPAEAAGLLDLPLDFAAACVEASGGAPYLITELGTALTARGMAASSANIRRVRSFTPDSVLRMVLDRVHRAGPEAVALARAVAILEEPAEPSLCLEISGATPTAISQLAALRILGDGLTFRHPLIRDGLLAELTPDQRRSLHRKAARALHARAGETERMAAHITLGDLVDEEWVVDVLVEAARIAQHRGALSETCAHLDWIARLLGPENRSEVLVQLGQVQVHLDPEAAARTFREAIPGSSVALRERITAELSRVQRGASGSHPGIG